MKNPLIIVQFADLKFEHLSNINDVFTFIITSLIFFADKVINANIFYEF